MAQGFVIRSLVPAVSPFDISYPNTANLSTGQYLFCVDNGTALAVAGTNVVTLGVLQDGTDGSSRATVSTVRTAGLTKIILGQDANIGDYVKSGTNGQAYIVSTVSGQAIEGYLLDGGLSGQAVVMLIQHQKAA